MAATEPASHSTDHHRLRLPEDARKVSLPLLAAALAPRSLRAARLLWRGSALRGAIDAAAALGALARDPAWIMFDPPALARLAEVLDGFAGPAPALARPLPATVPRAAMRMADRLPARALAPWLSEDAAAVVGQLEKRRVTLKDIARGRFAGVGAAASLLDEVVATATARRELEARVRARALTLVDGTVPWPPPAKGPEPLAAWVLGRARHLRPRDVVTGRIRVHASGDPRGLIGFVPARKRRRGRARGTEVQLVVDDETGDVTAHFRGEKGAEASAGRAFAAAALCVLGEPDPEEAARLGAAGPDPIDAALSVLAARPPAPRPRVESGRVAWRVAGQAGALRVTAAFARGGEPGPAVSARRVLRAPRAGARDREAAARLDEGAPPASVLHALVGHRRVTFAGGPVAVRLAALEVRPWRDDDGALRLAPFVDGAALPASAPAHEDAAGLVVPRAGALVVVPLDGEARALLAAVRARPAVPPARLPEVRAALGADREGADLAPADVDADATPHVLLRARAHGGLSAQVRVRPISVGPFLLPGEGDAPCLAAADDGALFQARRDLAAERKRAHALVEALPLPDASGAWRYVCTEPTDALDLVDALDGHVAAGRAHVAWPAGERAVKTAAASMEALRVIVAKERDWFSLQGGVTLGEARVPLEDLLDAVRKDARWARADDATWVKLSAKLRAGLARLLALGGPRVPAGAPAALAFGDLAEAGASLEGAGHDAARALVSDDADDAAPVDGLRATLRPYQRDGVRWARRLARWGAGGVLADEMGLGKTVQAIAVLLARRARGPAIVVAPTSVLPVWQRELSRFAPDLVVRVSHGRGRARHREEVAAGEVLLTTWGTLVTDAAPLAEVRFATAIFDEAQAMKNALTRRAAAARGLDAQWRLALTGTPLENHLGELWSILSTVSPGLLGTWEQFKERFATPIEKHGDRLAQRALADTLAPFVLRREKRTVAPELLPRAERTVKVPLDDDEAARYRNVARHLAVVAKAAEGTPEGRVVLLCALTRLRQLACHPALDDDGAAARDAGASKLRALVAHLRDVVARGGRALVFSQFTRHLALARAALHDAGFRTLWLDGDTPLAARQARVDRFQAGEGDAFLISLRAGGTGLTLTAADTVFHLDPWWNPAVEDQATDRSHRIGQTRQVEVFRLVAAGTIEERVLELHDEKRRLFAATLAGTARGPTLDDATLRALLAGEAARGEAGG